MSLEISFTPNSSAHPQNLTLQDGESIQVFSGESFQIQNPEIVAQLVPQDKDLQIVCHDGTSFILKNFLEVDFTKEPSLELNDGASITWHNFVQQTEGIDHAFNVDDPNNSTLVFAPLLVIAATAKSPEWSFAQVPISEEESPEITTQPQQFSQTTSSQPKGDPLAEDDSFSKATAQNIDDDGIKLASGDLGTPQSGGTANTASNTKTPEFIEIDVRKFLDISGDGINPSPVITGVVAGNDGTEIEIDDLTGIAKIPNDILEDNTQLKIDIIVDDGNDTKNTTITVIESKDGGGETFHLILSQNQVSENQEGALIGKLDTDDAGRNHTYEYTLSKDSSDLFQITGNVLKLKDGVSIDYETHPESYPIRIVATDETGHKIEQTIDIWPKDINEIAGVSPIVTSNIEDIRVNFDPDDFDTAFEDEDNDYLEMVRIDTLPGNGTLSLEDDAVTIGQLIDYEQIAELSFQPTADWNGNTVFQWSGFDGSAWSAENSPVSISIEAANDAPVVSVKIGQQATSTDEAFAMSLPDGTFIDVDSGDTLSYSAELPSWLTIDPSTGALSGTPTDEHIGDQDITITATDGSGESASQTFRLSVENTNDGPTVSSSIPDATTDKDDAFSLGVSGNFDDKDLGDELSYNATLDNGDGDNEIDGGKHNDDITSDSGDGDDTIDATDGYGTVDTGAGDDTITIDYGVSSGGGRSGSGTGSGSKSGSGGGSGSGGNFGMFDSGDGDDTLEFDRSNLEIDLTVLDSGGIQNIERLDIDGSGSNNLRLRSDDILDMTDSENRLFIDGGNDDHVEISKDFQSDGTETVGGVDYQHYYDAGTDSHLYINNNITDLDTF
ncbi:MAG: hypothetical protein HOA81_09730 [Opitutales bacterium]|nr:hypothetical protein [Opitutales bacterium]